MNTQITECDPLQVIEVGDAVLNELDQIRSGAYAGGIEERLDRLELAVLTLSGALHAAFQP